MHGVVVALFALLIAAPLAAQDAQSIMKTMATRQAQRWADVENYAIERLVQGAPFAVPTYFERHTDDGVTTFRAVPFNEWQKEAAGTEDVGAEQFDDMAVGYDVLASAYGKAAPSDPMAPLIVSMLQGGAVFMRAGGDAERTGAAYVDGVEDGVNVGGMADFARRARLDGREQVGGRDAFLLRADELDPADFEQAAGEASFTPEMAEFWIDASEYVPLRMKITGTMESDGRSTPFSLEMRQEEYTQVGPLYEPQRQVLRMTGLMESLDEKQRREMEQAMKDAEKAKAEYEKMKPQLERLPAAARQMVEGQMQKALDQLDRMAGEGVFETIVEIRVLGINEGPPVDWRPPVTGRR